MAIKDLINGAFSGDEKDELEETVTNTQIERHIVKVYEPVAKSETTQIIDALKRGEMCCVNLIKVDENDAKLMYSSLSGASHALDATLKFIDGRTIVCAPKNFLINEEN